jgi:hypothetical protein
MALSSFRCPLDKVREEGMAWHGPIAVSFPTLNGNAITLSSAHGSLERAEVAGA